MKDNCFLLCDLVPNKFSKLLQTQTLKTSRMGGCLGDSPSNAGMKRTKSQDNEILLLIRKIKHDFQLKQQRRAKELKEQQQLILENLHKQVKTRSQRAEESLIRTTLFFKHINEIYFICQTEAKIILDYKESLENSLRYVQPALQTLVYCCSILKEDQLYQLQSKLKKQFPEFRYPEEKDIRHQLVRWHKTTETVPFQKENNYVMDFSSRYGISMEQIKAVGHNYGYGAKEK